MLNISFDNIVNAFAYKSDKELKSSKFLFSLMGYPLFVPIATRITPLIVKFGLPIVNKMIRKTIFKQFVGGETLEATSKVADILSNFGVQVVLDYGAEAIEGEDNFEDATNQFIKTIEYAASKPNMPYISIKVSSFSRHGLLQALNEAPRLRSGIHDHENQEAEWDRVCDRMYRICEAAAKNNIGVWVDAEESWLQDPVDRLTIEMMEEFNSEKAIVYNTIQLYRHDRLNFLQLSHKIAKERGFVLGIKLVRGAYMEKERARANQKGYPSPIQASKANTDRDYNAAIAYCINNIGNIAFAVASHNEESNLFAATLLDEKGLAANHPHIHFSQLYGMSDNITFNLAKAGYPVSKYLPFGPIKEVIPYLMRRAQENSSVSGQTGREISLIIKEIARRKAALKGA
ncbi:proline dehydrogenase family protein [Parasediminibacterium sp. JCM 36343]|uniref:proline dehydrogenase family protein n=1 Tax=Parasediminibacterium sp. JCM 36343 TaxID=3374279 RepID=UPI00397A53E7